MSSPLFAALAKLDESLQDVQIQVDWLRAGIEVGDDDFQRSLHEAHQSAVAIRDLIHAERPNASWNDRLALEQLMQDLEREAQIRLAEQRRSRLQDLASELDAGAVRHRFESRAASLNSLRLDAVRELRVAAALPNQDRELPGPGAGDWIHWLCNLPEDNYATVFDQLRRDFPALEAFAVEMEESYWAPGEGRGDAGHSVPARAPEPAPPSRDRQSSSVPVISDYRKAPHNVRVPPADVAVKSGGPAAAAVAGGGAQMSAAAAPALAEMPWAMEQSWQAPAAVETTEEEVQLPPAPPIQICEKCGATYTSAFHACAVDQSTLQMAAQALPAVKAPGNHSSNGKNGSNGNGSAALTADHYESIVESAKELSAEPAAAELTEETSATDTSRETAEKEFHRLRAIVEQRAQDSTVPEEEESVGLNLSRTQIIAIVVSICALMAVAITMVVHYYSAKSEAATTAAAAAAKAPPVVSDADIQKQIEQKLTELKNSQIEVAVQGGVVTLTGHSSTEEESVQADDLSVQTSGVKVVRDRIQVDAHAASNGKPHAGKPAQQH